MKWWLYVDYQEETEGIVDGINDTPANATDDYYDNASTTPTFLIYTNDPNPDPADVEHVLISGGSHPYDGYAEWKLEAHWQTYRWDALLRCPAMVGQRWGGARMRRRWGERAT